MLTKTGENRESPGRIYELDAIVWCYLTVGRELSLGTPIVWDEFSPPDPWLGQHELYIPTYNRWVDWFDHGDFAVDGDRVAIFRQPNSGKMYVSRYLENGQQTLPEHFPGRKMNSLRKFERVKSNECLRFGASMTRTKLLSSLLKFDSSDTISPGTAVRSRLRLENEITLDQLLQILTSN